MQSATNSRKVQHDFERWMVSILSLVAAILAVFVGPLVARANLGIV
jgi:hypothetical protein